MKQDQNNGPRSYRREYKRGKGMEPIKCVAQRVDREVNSRLLNGYDWDEPASDNKVGRGRERMWQEVEGIKV